MSHRIIFAAGAVVVLGVVVSVVMAIIDASRSPVALVEVQRAKPEQRTSVDPAATKASANIAPSSRAEQGVIELAGVRGKFAAPVAPPTDAPPVAAEPSYDLEFAGKKWIRIGEVDEPGWGKSKKIAYSNGSEGTRALEIIPPESVNSRYLRILKTQVNGAGRWVDDGITQYVNRDGSRSEFVVVLGHTTSTYRAWYADGKPRSESFEASDRSYKKEWWENGKPKFEGYYMNGRLTCTGRWDENGNELPLVTPRVATE